MSLIANNFNMSFGRISNFTASMNMGAQLGLSSSISNMASAAGLAGMFGASAMESASSFTAFGGAGGFNVGAGFLPPVPFGLAMPPAMQSGMFGNPGMFGGGAWAASIGEAFGSLQMGAASFGGAGQLFGGWAGMQSAVMGMSSITSQQLALGSAFGIGGAAGFSANSTSVADRAASFPSVKGDSYLQTLSSTKTKAGKRANAKALNVSGKHDVKVINQAIDRLNTASAKVSVAQPGDKTGKGKLVLSAEEVAAIRSAPTDAAAQEVLRGIIGKQTGASINGNMNDKKGIRKKGSRQALNQLLGTKVRNGREKNSGSSMVMNSMLESITKSVRGGNLGSTTVSQDYAVGALGSNGVGAFGFFAEGSSSMTVNKEPSALAVDLSSYTDTANKVGELYSPLIFDLEGQGLKLKSGGLIAVDLDGDGKTEMVTELDAHIGLLVFDSRLDEGDDTLHGAGRDMFGNGTDLSAYDIEGSFDNGFDALRALAEHLELVQGDKQHLDAEDLLLLEKAVGLRMRVGGVVAGENRRFANLGITRINLGDPEGILSLEASPEDAYGNKLMHQDGATFTVQGAERPYADLWFNIVARTDDSDLTDAAIAGDGASTQALLAANRR